MLKQKKRKILLEIIAGLSALGLVLLLTLHLTHTRKVSSAGVSGTTNPTESSDSVSTGTSPVKSNNSGNAAKAVIDQQANSSTTSTDGPSIFVSTAGQNGDTVRVRSQVSDGIPTNCRADFSISGGNSFSQTASPVFTGTYYICNFDVPTDNFASSGSWHLAIIAVINSKSVKYDYAPSVEVTK